jgi:hypothetical protein
MILPISAAPVHCNGLLSLCPADAGADLLACRPHPSRPGPQPHNLVAVTFEEQLARARTPRASPEQMARAETVALVEDIVRRVLVKELPAALEYLLSKEETRNVG